MQYMLAQERAEKRFVRGRPLQPERFAPKRRQRIARKRVSLTRRGNAFWRYNAAIKEYQVWEKSIKKTTYVGLEGKDDRDFEQGEIWIIDDRYISIPDSEITGRGLHLTGLLLY